MNSLKPLDSNRPLPSTVASLPVFCSIAPAQNSEAVYLSNVSTGPGPRPQDEIWRLRADEGGYAVVSLTDSSEVISLAGADAASGSAIVQTQDMGTKWQRWMLSAENNYWRITSVHNQHSLDYQIANPHKAATVVQTDSRTSTQQWIISSATLPESLTVLAEFQIPQIN